MAVSEPSFLFADIAGFTALTEAHGDLQATELVTSFCARVRDAAEGYDAELIKTIGDAVMVRAARPAEAVLLALLIVHDLMRDHGAPTVRAGVHSGPAVERDGDWYGASVNLTARIAGVAAGGEVLLSESTYARAGAIEHVRFADRGPQRLRNVRDPVHLYAATRSGSDADRALMIDPVCRMAVEPTRAAGRLEHAGETFYFCSLACAGEFARDPDPHLAHRHG